MGDVHGQQGLEWSARLPVFVSRCARRWSLKVMPPYEPLSYSYVAPALREDGTSAVLKLRVPSQELVAKIEAVRVFDGDGIVRLLESGTSLGALHLERLAPGVVLVSVEADRQVTAIAAEVMRRL